MTCLSSATLAATILVMVSMAQMAAWALHSTDRTPWSAVLWKRAERKGLVFRASILAVTRECRLEGAVLAAGVSSSTFDGNVGASRRMGVLIAATIGTGAGGGGAGLGDMAAVIDEEMSLMASRQATLIEFHV